MTPPPMTTTRARAGSGAPRRSRPADASGVAAWVPAVSAGGAVGLSVGAALLTGPTYPSPPGPEKRARSGSSR